MAREPPRESCCRCCLPLSDAAVFALPLPRLSFSFVVPRRFSHFPFFSPLFFSAFLLLTADNAAWQLLPSGPGKTRFGKLKIANEARRCWPYSLVAARCSLGFSRCLGTQLQFSTLPLILRGLIVCVVLSCNAFAR